MQDSKFIRWKYHRKLSAFKKIKLKCFYLKYHLTIIITTYLRRQGYCSCHLLYVQIHSNSTTQTDELHFILKCQVCNPVIHTYIIDYVCVQTYS